jgi:DNA polymerase
MVESTPQERMRAVIGALRVFAEEAKESFAEGFPRGAVAAEPLETATASRPSAAPLSDEPPQTLRSIRQDIGDCQRCKLAKSRTHIVFGVGNPAADLMFVGEGPGEDEDRKGEPFVGRAGQLLTEIITNGMGLSRGDVYIANVVKCRPPGNRNPEPDEIAECKPFLLSQIDAVAPKVIVALGKFAAHTLLDTTLPISKLRGRWFDFRGRRLMPTFHPSYLLRTPSEKKLAWEDIKQVMQALDLPLPKAAKPRA